VQYLLARRVFDELGYRRYEWKCNAANAASKRAAERLGFSFEGTFRKHLVVKGKNRDTAWFSITDDEWPRVRKAYELWLDQQNFDAEGNQHFSLLTLNAAAPSAGDWTLRRAGMADVEAVVQLQKDAYAKTWAKLGGEPIPLKWDYREVLARQEVWLMEEGGEPIGALIVEPHTDHLYIESVAIHPDHCGKGLGNDLLAAAESRARALRLTELRLITGEKMDNNFGWYDRKGFEIAEVEQLSDRKIVHMRRVLG
jgi:ribosomal protein S18 acetylase RimI-like enzyme